MDPKRYLKQAIQLVTKASYEGLSTWEEIFAKAVADGIAEVESGLFQLPEDIKAKIADLAKKEFLRIVGDPAELTKDMANSNPNQNSLAGSVQDYVYDEAIGATRSEAYYLLERISAEMGDGTYEEALKRMEEKGI
jgi:predicted transcriptional regulator